MIRVLMVDDHAILREPLAIMLEQQADVEVVGQADTVGEALRLLAQGLAADVAIVDLSLPDGDGTQVIRRFLGANPDGSVLVLTAFTDQTEWARAVAAGALGVLHKSAAPETIVAAVRRLHGGESLFSGSQLIELVRLAGDRVDRERQVKEALDRLTPRELEVVQILAEGLSDKGVADRLFISSKTVRIHVANILEKLQLESRLQLVLFAANHGLVEIRWSNPRPPLPPGTSGQATPEPPFADGRTSRHGADGAPPAKGRPHDGAEGPDVRAAE